MAIKDCQDVLIYKNGKWNSVGGASIYAGGKWNQVSAQRTYFHYSGDWYSVPLASREVQMYTPKYIFTGTTQGSESGLDGQLYIQVEKGDFFVQGATYDILLSGENQPSYFKGAYEFEMAGPSTLLFSVTDNFDDLLDRIFPATIQQAYLKFVGGGQQVAVVMDY